MIGGLLHYKRIIDDYSKHWDKELFDLLESADTKTSQLIKNSIKSKRKNANKSGGIIPIILDTLEIEEQPNKSDFMLSAYDVGVGMLDDISEGIPSIEKNDLFSQIYEHLKDGTIIKTKFEINSSLFLFKYVIKNMNGSEEQFFATTNRLKNAVENDDFKYNLDSRIEVGRAYGENCMVFLNARLNTDFSKYKNFLESIFTGPTILDDLSDVFEDFGVKNTIALEYLDGKKPSIYNILSKKIIPKLLLKGEKELNKGFLDLKTEQSIKKYQTIVDSFKKFYVINLGRKYIQNKLN